MLKESFYIPPTKLELSSSTGSLGNLMVESPISPLSSFSDSGVSVVGKTNTMSSFESEINHYAGTIYLPIFIQYFYHSEIEMNL